MAKHIKPFLPGIYDINEDSFIDYEHEKSLRDKQQMSVNPESVDKMRNVHKDKYLENIEQQLKSALNDYWKNKKEAENIILEAKSRLDANVKKMFEEFEKAIQKLDSLGISIKDNEIELDELVVVLRKEEKMYELTDKDKSELYDIFVSLNKKHAESCLELAKSMNAISEITEYTEFGVYYKKPEGSKRYKEAYFRKEILNPMKESEYINESIFSKIVDFFKSMGEQLKNYIFSIESSLEEFDSLMNRAKNILSR